MTDKTAIAKAREAERCRPRPDGGWSHRVEVLRQPVIVPPKVRAFEQPGGILRANGSYCAQGALWRKNRPLTSRPAAPEQPPETLDGEWLWGGVLWRHFGHFLVESTGRLWALMALPDGVRGVLFIPKSPALGATLEGYQKDFFDMAGAPSVRLLDRPARPEKLYVPGQGFGLGQIASGTVHAQRWFRDHFARDIPAEGPDKLYISRSGLSAGRAKLLCEDRLDRYLESQGYTVFHPQDHDLRTQVARYKAARQVIACEGSAIHLFAMVVRPTQRLAIIVRRLSAATHYIETHVTGFSGNAPLTIDAICRGWLPKGKATRRHQVSELDFAKAQQMLTEAGFVAPGPIWEQPTPDDIKAAKAAAFAEELLLVET